VRVNSPNIVMYILFDSIEQRLKSLFSLEALSQMLTNGLINIFLALAVFFAFYGSWRLLRIVTDKAFQRAGGDVTTASFVQAVLKFTILTIGVVSALDVIGIQTSAIITSLGIAGLTIGFAAKDALSNLISGLLIFLDRPFVIGDLVEIDGHYGRVERITLRSTRIVTNDGKMLAVPNTEIINRTVASYTNFPHLRLDVAVNIAVTESIESARSALLQLVNGKPEYMIEPAPRVVVRALNDYNNALELQVWIHDETRHIEYRFALREQIFNALNEAGIEMPMETLQLAPVTVQLDRFLRK
jgi:small conductance mechanosensitive channel